jgi:hypothetical protein
MRPYRRIYAQRGLFAQIRELLPILDRRILRPISFSFVWARCKHEVDELKGSAREGRATSWVSNFRSVRRLFILRGMKKHCVLRPFVDSGLYA